MAFPSMFKSSRVARNSLLMSIVVIGAIAGYGWIISPHISYLQAAEQYERVTETHLRLNNIMTGDINAKKKNLIGLQESFAKLRSRLFSPTEAKEFFSNIQIVANRVNCIVGSLRFSPAGSVAKVDQSNSSRQIVQSQASFSVMGGYGSIVALMTKLQDCPQQVWIDSVKIKPNQQSAGQLICDATVRVYIMQDKGSDAHD